MLDGFPDNHSGCRFDSKRSLFMILSLDLKLKIGEKRAVYEVRDDEQWLRGSNFHG